MAAPFSAPAHKRNSASCGVQTDEHRLISGPNLNEAQRSRSSVPWKGGPFRPPVVRSKLIAPYGEIVIPKGHTKKRRLTPWSNWAFNLPAQVPTPEEFHLGSFAFTHLPDPVEDWESYNDDLYIEHYRASERSYLGAQRRGLLESFPDATSYEDHITNALSASFPLYGTTDLPYDLLNALHFNRDNSVQTVAEFRNTQLKHLHRLAEECQSDTDRWFKAAPTGIRRDSGNVHIALLAHLMRFTRMQGTNWLMQFVFGFPITGKLSQKGVFPPGKGDTTPLRDPESLFSSKTARFRERAARSGSRYTRTLWDEAIGQVHKGWFSPPERLDDNGCYVANTNDLFNIAFRFGVLQTDKLRGCDDFKDSLTNEACSVETPITLPCWDHIAAATKILSANKRKWVFGKIDHKDAYKALPLRPSDAKYAIIALRNPDDKSWYGFRSNTLLFGSTAAVLHYNCVSRIIASLACRILLLPTVGYFDDFGFLTADEDSSEAFRAFKEFFLLLGFELKVEKSFIGNWNSFLGMDAIFPSPVNGMTLSISLSEEKAIKWSNLIDRILSEHSISHTTLESLIGRMAFAQTAVFGKFARAMLKPLYAKLYAPGYTTAISPAIRRNLEWWRATLRSKHQRITAFDRSRPDWVLYTDAAFAESEEGARLAAIFFRVETFHSFPGADLVITGRPSVAEVAYFSRTSTIFGLELAAVVLSLFFARKSLSGKAITVYIDNNAALAAIINGDSAADAAFPLIATLWFIAAQHNISLWFERVESSRNIADIPTRKGVLSFPVRENATFPRLEEALEYYTSNIANSAPTLVEMSLSIDN